MPSIEDIHAKQNKSIDSLIASFSDNLHSVVLRAQGKALAQLQKKLSITNGVIDATPGNNRILRTLDDMFMDAMEDAGYERLLKAFVDQFPGQLPFVNEIIEALGSQMANPLPKWNPSATDRSVLASLQANSVGALEMAVESVARTATQNVMFAVGGLKFSDLATTLAAKFELSVGRATSLADTTISTWYRTATDRAFQFIEKDLPSMEIRYRYTLGPDDKVTRPWCENKIQQTKAGKTWTRSEIEQMSNGQLPNVFLSCGGWNCRHSWLIAVN